MEEKILEVIVSKFIEYFLEESKGVIGKLSAETKQFFSNEIKHYLNKQQIKYSYIKTLLHGNTPIYLYDIYFPLKISIKNKTINTDSISNIFKITNFITLIGEAGCGKSTLIKHLFLNTIKEKYCIPVLIELRYLNNYDGTIENYIMTQIDEHDIVKNFTILEKFLKKGKFIFFLDGFDELTSEIRGKIINDLNTFIDKYSDNKYIITSRPYSNIEHLPRFHNCLVKKIKNEEIFEFVKLQLKNEDELAYKIIDSIKENKKAYLNSFLTNPLLLSLYILTFQNNPTIPDKRFIFYRRVIQALFSEHDSRTKLGYTRERETNLTQEQFEEILKRFSLISFFENLFDFPNEYLLRTLRKIKNKFTDVTFENKDFITDLKLSVALWIDDNGIISFAHRSLQEYFAALFIKELNKENKEIAYSKILEKVLYRKHNEIYNFVSLCKEMDEYYYYKLFYIPIFKELKKYINANNETSLINSTINFFLRAFKIIIWQEDQSYCRLYDRYTINQFAVLEELAAFNERFKKCFTAALYEENVYQYLIQNKCIAKFEIENDEERIHLSTKTYGFDLKFNKIPFPFLDLLKKHEVFQVAKDFNWFINSSINKAENFIIKSNNSDNDFISLI